MLKKYFPAIFFILSLTIYGILANILRGCPDFNDETEKLVGAMMIADGMKIYKDMFAHHGPLSYMVAHLFYWISNSRDIATYRFIPMIFSAFSIAAIAFTPAIKKTDYRLFAASLFALGLSAMQAIYGLMMGMYQIYTGHLLVCALALLIIPIIVGNKIPRLYAFLGGLCLGFAFFSAYSFVVACSFLMLICVIKAFVKNEHQSENKITFYNVIFGAITAVIITAIYLYFFGDFKGYAAYHFYFNQVIYSKISNYQPLDILYFVPPVIGYFTNPNIPSSWLSYAISSSVSIFAVLMILSIKNTSKKPATKIIFLYGIILIFGIIFSDPRADDNFRMNTLVIVTLGFVSLATCMILERFKTWRSSLPIITIASASILFVSFIIAQFTMKTYLYEASPIRYYRLTGSIRESQEKDFKLLQTIVLPDEKVQQFPFNLNFYILINRLPASGVFYLFPSIDKYFENPALGYKIDFCRELEERLPKVIYYDRSVIWGYPSASYLGCFENFLQKKYLETSIMKFAWIRADIMASREDLLATAIIPDNFDYSWLDKNSQTRLKKRYKTKSD